MNGTAYVVFGASGGIGSALCRRLAARGARLVLAGRSAEKLTALAAELGGNAVTVAADATRSADVDAVFSRAVEAFDRIDGAAHCVGSLMLKPAHLTTDEDWAATLTANLTSAFYLVRAAARTMTSGGSIVLVSSVAARIGLANHEAIAAAKAGVVGLMLSAAATYASRNLRVNAVAPGLVQTPLTARLTASEPARKASTAMHPLGRIGEPDDVARLIEWLLDPVNSWMTAQVIGLDGGLGDLRSR